MAKREMPSRNSLTAEDFPSNSFKSKENKQDKKVEKVVKGKAKPKKKTNMQKFSDVFISEDVGDVKSYIIWDVLIPSIKKAISDIVTDGIDMILYGSSGRTKKRQTSRVSYGNYYDGSDRKRDRGTSTVRNGCEYENIIFESRGDAEKVLSSMDEIIDMYEFVSVADLYDLADISTDKYTLNNYGWTNLHSARVVKCRGEGWTIKFPKALPLN